MGKFSHTSCGGSRTVRGAIFLVGGEQEWKTIIAANAVCLRQTEKRGQDAQCLLL